MNEIDIAVHIERQKMLQNEAANERVVRAIQPQNRTENLLTNWLKRTQKHATNAGQLR